MNHSLALPRVSRGDASAAAAVDARSRWFHRILLALLLFEASAIWMHFSRVTVGNDISGLVSKGYMSLVLAVVGVALVGVGARLNSINLLFGLMMLQGVWVGSAIPEHDLLKPWVSHVVYWLIMFLSFNVGANTPIDWRKLGEILTRYGKLIVYATAIGLVTIEVYRVTSGVGLYAGYQGSQLLLPLGVALALRDRRLLLITFIVLVLVSRRGPLAAGVLALATVWTIQRAKGVFTGMAMSLIPALAAVALLSVVVNYVITSGAYAESSTVFRVSQKWQRLFEFEEDATLATSGRDMEIKAVVRLFEGDPLKWLAGRGFGWYVYPYHNVNVPLQFIHLSYLNVIATHGVLLGGLFLLCVAREIYGCHVVALHGLEHREVAWMLAFILLAVALVSLTVALLQVSILFWLLLGAAHQANRTIPIGRPATRRLA